MCHSSGVSIPSGYSVFQSLVFVYMPNGLYMDYGLSPVAPFSRISETVTDIFFLLPCTAMPTRDGARQIPHDPFAKPCRCRACRRRWWTFPKAGYRCIAYYQSRPPACLARISTSSHSTSPIMHTIHHHTPNHHTATGTRRKHPVVCSERAGRGGGAERRRRTASKSAHRGA